MGALLDMPSITNATTFHLDRWEEVCANPTLRQLPDRIETNRYGQIVMMPPPGFSHSSAQSMIITRLHAFLPNGETLGECAVLTSDGVKGLDAAWISSARVKRGLKRDVLTVAPEICVEVISPGNTRQEIEGKRRLYFEAGAEEVWICDRKGLMHFFLKSNEEAAAEASQLCPEMPRNLKG